MKYAIYCEDGRVLTLYSGERDPTLSNFIVISDLDYEICLDYICDFSVVGKTLTCINNHLYHLRRKRDWLLQATDKHMLPDYPIDEEKRNQWRSYRQQLRDLPETYSSNNILWPISPED